MLHLFYEGSNFIWCTGIQTDCENRTRDQGLQKHAGYFNYTVFKGESQKSCSENLQRGGLLAHPFFPFIHPSLLFVFHTQTPGPHSKELLRFGVCRNTENSAPYMVNMQYIHTNQRMESAVSLLVKCTQSLLLSASRKESKTLTFLNQVSSQFRPVVIRTTDYVNTG